MGLYRSRDFPSLGFVPLGTLTGIVIYMYHHDITLIASSF